MNKGRVKMSMRKWLFLALSSLLTLCSISILPAAEPEGKGKTTHGNGDLNFAQVIFVEAIQGDDGSWCIYATVRHNDEGWDHYANAWQVVDKDGNELAWRLLAHPHDDEQPFEREKCRIDIPMQTTKVAVQAKCNVHGFGGQSVAVDLEVTEGENFKVTRAERQGKNPTLIKGREGN